MNCHLQAPTSIKEGKHKSKQGKMHKRSTLKRVIYKEGPHVRANGGTKANAPRDLDMGPQIRLPEEDKDERRPGGAGQPPGSAEPGRPSVQVHFEESAPSLLITFHMCIWREPTSTSINRAPSHPSQHTHFIPFSPRRLSSLLLS